MVVHWHVALVVSTHAPARGATTTLAPHTGQYLGFNSRAREGRDAWSTRAIGLAARFNSRAREGRDKSCDLSLDTMQLVSTHAPARGATRPRTMRRLRQRSFNSRAREGRDIASHLTSTSCASFNSRAREGRDAR